MRGSSKASLHAQFQYGLRHAHDQARHAKGQKAVVNTHLQRGDLLRGRRAVVQRRERWVLLTAQLNHRLHPRVGSSANSHRIEGTGSDIAESDVKEGIQRHSCRCQKRARVAYRLACFVSTRKVTLLDWAAVRQAVLHTHLWPGGCSVLHEGLVQVRRRLERLLVLSSSWLQLKAHRGCRQSDVYHSLL